MTDENFLNKIENKHNQINYLKQEIKYKRIEEQLKNPQIIKKFEQIEKEIVKEVCSDVPTAFWNRNSFEIGLPYEEG